jgi:hypothetical protein
MSAKTVNSRTRSEYGVAEGKVAPDKSLVERAGEVLGRPIVDGPARDDDAADADFDQRFRHAVRQAIEVLGCALERSQMQQLRNTRSGTSSIEPISPP